jgi:hypothetical protein
MHSALLAVFSRWRSLGSDIEAVSHPNRSERAISGSDFANEDRAAQRGLEAVRVSERVIGAATSYQTAPDEPSRCRLLRTIRKLSAVGVRRIQSLGPLDWLH